MGVGEPEIPLRVNGAVDIRPLSLCLRDRGVHAITISCR
jgi:hypothetical protein